MSGPLTEARLRAERVRCGDGLYEITVGALFLLMGGSDLIRSMGNKASSWYQPILLICTLLFVALAIPRISAMRQRITYPRSGYVDYGESRWRRGIVAGGVGLVCAVACVLALRYAHHAGVWDPARWLPAVAGVMCGVACVYMGVSLGLQRFFIVGMFSIILGTAVCTAYPPRLAMGLYLAGVGCALLSSGGVTLRNYLCTAPPPANET